MPPSFAFFLQSRLSQDFGNGALLSLQQFAWFEFCLQAP